MNSIKTIPLRDLSLVAVIFQCDEDDEGRPIFEHEVYNEEAFNRTSIPKRTRCDCCGKPLKYSCLVEHTPTHEVFFIGRDCARTMESLRGWTSRVQDISLALATRAECNAREARLMARYPDLGPTIAWALTGINRTAKDIADKRRSFELSDAQVDFLRKLYQDDVARRAAATATCPKGRQTVQGTVLSVKFETKPGFGYRAPDVVLCKVLVDLGTGAKVYGNLPTASFDPITKTTQFAKGDRVSFTATFEPSERDNLFGFWKVAKNFQKVPVAATSQL